MRKEKRTYYFSVEGETEKWYLDWLQKTINADPGATCIVNLDSKIQKDPVARAKGMTILGKTEITHIFNRESEEAVHQEQFQTTLERMKQAERRIRKNPAGSKPAGNSQSNDNPVFKIAAQLLFPYKNRTI